MLCFLTFFSSFHCSSLAHHSDPRVLFPVPLLLNSLPGDLHPLDELYAQKLKYKAISEELDHALNDMTSLWEIARVLPSVLAILKSAFSLWCLFPWASRSSHFLPPGLTLQATFRCVCDWNKDGRSSSSCPLIFIFSTCRFWAVVAVMPLTMAATESGGSDEELISERKLCPCDSLMIWKQKPIWHELSDARLANYLHGSSSFSSYRNCFECSLTHPLK